MNKSEQIDKLSAALSKAQGEMKGAIKDSANPFFKSKYADLSSVWDACRESLSANGLSVTQIPDVELKVQIIDERQVTIEKFVLITTLLHSSGQWMSGSYPINPVKSDPQAVGGAITYARRYSLAAIVGVSQEDDDGEVVMARKRPTKILVKKEIADNVVSQTLDALANNDKSGLEEIWNEFNVEEKVELWKLFNSKERSAIKKIQKGE